MQFLKTIFWVATAVLLAVFTVSNWTPITITLWSGLVLETYLPIPIFAALILGLLPYFILHRATRWSMQRRISQMERQLAETRALLSPADTENQEKGTIPPSAAPIAVPPGVL
jgi:uncharacterized integral membrane protein